jgi:lysylphosphatidylglycerol synthetase-like protein (DUF2156 family)
VSSVAHLLALVAGLALLALAPRLWRGTGMAVSLAIAWLAILAVLNIVKGTRWDQNAWLERLASAPLQDLYRELVLVRVE